MEDTAELTWEAALQVDANCTDRVAHRSPFEFAFVFGDKAPLAR